MHVAERGDFTATLPIGRGKRFNRFVREGEPAIMGAHLYMNSGAYALRINNGTLEKDESGNYSWRGVVRYSKLEIVAPPGYVLLTEDYKPAGLSIVLYDGAPVYFLPRAVIETRFFMVRAGVTPVSAFEIRPVTEYGPSNLPLPDVSNINYEAVSAASYEAWLNAWNSGNPLGSWDSQTRRIGAQMAAGDPAAYTHGGNGIDPNHGYEQCKSGVLLRRFKHSRWMDRMNAAIFDGRGRQLTVHDFNAPMQVAQIRGAGFWQWQNELPAFLTGDWNNTQYAYFNPGPADAGQWDMYSVDPAHIIRAISNGIAVWEYTRDPMVADDLLMLFENIRFTDFSDRGDEVEYNPSYTPPSLRALNYRVRKWPHQGLEIDRAFGWALYLGAQVNKMGFGRRVWLKKMLDIANDAMMPNGIVSRNYSDYFPAPTIQGVQTFHEMIICIGYHAACTQLEQDPSNKLKLVCSNVLGMPSINGEYSPNGDTKGPPHWIWTHVNNTQQIPVSSETSTGSGDPAHVCQVLALAYLSTQDTQWLELAKQHWFVVQDLQAKLAVLKTMTDKSWGATLQAVLENVL